jgi:acyl dehydratase
MPADSSQLIRLRYKNKLGSIKMITQTMVQPSFWIEVGIQIQKVRGLNLFKFNDDLQARLEVLIDRQKANILTAEETTELAGITELDRIFTLMNARIIAES